MKMALVLTTIHDPILLDEYAANLREHGHLEQTEVYVIPDRKTPPEAYRRCAALERQGLKVVCPDLEMQETFLDRVGFTSHLIPYNSDNRRNVGYLMALESGADFVISIDDDNYCRSDKDFFREHAIVCDDNRQVIRVDTETGWFNICSMMTVEPAVTTYARGFPYYARHKTERPKRSSDTADIHINAGLWLLDPDVDGITWLVNPAHTVAFDGQSLVLGDKAWSPVNTQNTALRREAIAAYYFVRMNYPLAGIPIDRYGDIFSGYFVQVCARHLGGCIRVGSPVADHRRNSHNYMNDAANELACILTLEDLLPWLTEDLVLSGSTYCETYECLSHCMEDAVEHFNGRIWTDATRGYFHQMAYCMRQWTSACRSILGQTSSRVAHPRMQAVAGRSLQ